MDNVQTGRKTDSTHTRQQPLQACQVAKCGKIRVHVKEAATENISKLSWEPAAKVECFMASGKGKKKISTRPYSPDTQSLKSVHLCSPWWSRISLGFLSITSPRALFATSDPMSQWWSNHLILCCLSNSALSSLPRIMGLFQWVRFSIGWLKCWSLH